MKTASVPVHDVAGSARDPATPRSGSTVRSSVVMAAGTVVSRVLGLVRTALLATAIGAAGGYLWQSKLNAVVVLAVGGVVSAAVYAGMLRLLRVTELSQLTGSLIAQVRRNRA